MRRFALFAFLVSACLPSVALAGGASTDCVEPYEAEVARLVNAERAKAGLAPLRLQDNLSASAEHEVQDATHSGVYGHGLADGTTWSQNVTNHGYLTAGNRYAGENIAIGRATPAEVMAAWMASPDHKHRILSPDFRDVGVGYTPGVVSYNGYGYNRAWAIHFGAAPGPAAWGAAADAC